MSFRIFFDLSYGLSRPLTAPAGTLQKILDHVAKVESALGFEKEKSSEGHCHWKSTTPAENISDEVLCEIADHHNWYVGYLYENFGNWSENPPVGNTEVITPEQSQEFFYGLQIITAPFERWTPEYYKNRMNALYKAFRGEEAEGVSFDEKPLTIKQARSVMLIFQDFTGIDRFNLDLDVPRGHDELFLGEDLYWCEKCGQSVL